jgi:hypothetical protein
MVVEVEVVGGGRYGTSKRLRKRCVLPGLSGLSANLRVVNLILVIRKTEQRVDPQRRLIVNTIESES